MNKKYKSTVYSLIIKITFVLFFILLTAVESCSASGDCILHNGQREITNMEAYALLKPHGKAYLAFGAQKTTYIGQQVIVLDYGNEIVAVGVGKKSKYNVDEEESFTEQQEEETEQKTETVREAYLRKAKECLDEEDYSNAAEYYYWVGDNASALEVLTEHEQYLIGRYKTRGYGNLGLYTLGLQFVEYGNKEHGEELLRAYALSEEEDNKYSSAAGTYSKIGDTENANRCREIYLNSKY